MSYVVGNIIYCNDIISVFVGGFNYRQQIAKSAKEH